VNSGFRPQISDFKSPPSDTSPSPYPVNTSGKSQSGILRKVQTNALRNLAFVKVAKDSIPHHGLQLGQIASLSGNPATTRVIPRGAIRAPFIFNYLKDDLVHETYLSEPSVPRKRELSATSRKTRSLHKQKRRAHRAPSSLGLFGRHGDPFA